MTKKILALCCTGMPGIHRLLLFFLIERVIDQKSFGLFSIDYSLIQMFSFFTAVGWCGIVVAKIPKLNDMDKKDFLSKLLSCALIYYLGFSLIAYFFYLFGFINFIYSSLLFMLTWMLYQIFRHYWLTEKHYLKILVSDILSILFFSVLVVFGVDPYFSLGLSFLIAIAILCKGEIAFTRLSFFDIEEQKQAFEIGAFNFLLGLSSVALPFFVGRSGSVEYAGLLAYVLTLTTALQLVPRAIGFYYMPDLAKALDGEKFKEIYKKYVLVNYLVVTLSVLMLLCFGVFVDYFDFIAIFSLHGSFYIYVGLTACGAFLALSLPYVSYFMVREKTSFLRNIGIGNSLLTFIALMVFLLLSSDIAIFTLIVVLVVISIVNFLCFYYGSKKDLGLSS